MPRPPAEVALGLGDVEDAGFVGDEVLLRVHKRQAQEVEAGVGDRHLDNLLLAPDGHFFHADFGFILGRDPKPFAPAVKLSKEMVDAMGGTNGDWYLQFKQYCSLAFAALRKSSNLILNLFSLMVHANIPDIKLEPDKAVLKVQERFHLDLSEDEAIRLFWSIMEDSLSAYMPVVIDWLHAKTQALRA